MDDLRRAIQNCLAAINAGCGGRNLARKFQLISEPLFGETYLGHSVPPISADILTTVV